MENNGEGIFLPYIFIILTFCSSTFWASLVAQTVKNLPAMQETRVQSLGLEDPLEKGIAIHSSILAWEIPQIEELGRQKSQTRLSD